MRDKISFHVENINILILVLYCYLGAVLLADNAHTKPAALLLLICACACYVIFVKTSGNFADLRAILMLSWNGGLSLAILRLSALHSEWTRNTKLCFLAFPVFFLLASAFEFRTSGKKEGFVYSKAKSKRLLKLIYITSAVSLIVFIAEVIILGYVPAFSKDTHAYNYFHVTGLHYFTVSSMMTHSLTMIYYLMQKNIGAHATKNEKIGIIVANLISLMEALLCISKLQFLLIFGLPILIYMGGRPVKDFKELPWKRIALAAIGFTLLGVGAMVAFTYLRHYEPGYLQGIFEFRNPNTPVAIQYPYMYVANNYANFNQLTIGLAEHTHGLKQLFPVFALTGTKFIFPQMVNFPLYTVKEEINTLTIIYDAYYDFGIAGVCLLGIVLGLVAGALRRKANKSNPMWLLLYGQIALYFMLSFFSAWFSVATTWFWFALTLLYGIVIKGGVLRDKA